MADNKKGGDGLDLEKIRKDLIRTLFFGLIIGIIGVISYACSFCNDGAFQWWKMLSVFLILTSACFMSGFFTGILFGIPKRSKDENSQYELNNNLIEISDWLTKIIIGLGLVEIKRIPGYLGSVGDYIYSNIGGDNSIKVFSVCCIIYFSVFGLYFGYNYMKLVLSAQYKHVDDNMTAKRKELEKTVPDIYDMTNLDVKTPSVAKKKLKEYVDLLEKSKTVSEYTFEDWYYKGLAAFDDENYLMTVNCMQRALEKDNDNENIPNAYLYIGLSYQYLEMYKEALEQYDKILTDYPAYPNKDLIFYNKGVALDDMKEPLKALEEYDKALSIDNEYADVWYNKAAIYARQGDKAKMLDALKNAIDNDDECKPYAKKDKDFKDFWNDNEFIKLTT